MKNQQKNQLKKLCMHPFQSCYVGLFKSNKGDTSNKQTKIESLKTLIFSASRMRCGGKTKAK